MYDRCEYARGRVVFLGAYVMLIPVQARDKATEIISQAVLGVEPTDNTKTFEDLIDSLRIPWFFCLIVYCLNRQHACSAAVLGNL